jgi:CIC family chloride channel protein
VILRAAIIGALIGLALDIDPLTVGDSDALTQMLLAGHAFTLPVLVMYLSVRFLAGPLSYAAQTPGGLFAPLLALGALLGTIFGSFIQRLVPDCSSPPEQPLSPRCCSNHHPSTTASESLCCEKT